jgi:Uma2 family endonuclease
MTTLIAKMPNKPKSAPRQITLEQFLVKYDNLEDGLKYEWNNGVVEKTKAMSQQQFFILAILNRLFVRTKLFLEGGMLIVEGDMSTSEYQLRRPDVAIYTAEQLLSMRRKINQIAPWVAEVISPTDNADRINEKLEEYFNAGVQVVWHIYPTSQKVDVFTSVDHVKICRGKTICSAAPALNDFEITAEELFS